MPPEQGILPDGLAKDHSGANRRACVRYRCSRPIPRRMALAETYNSLEGWVEDISVTGLGLLLDRPLEIGTLLTVELESSPRAAPVELLARVVRTTVAAEKEWLIGCEFVNPLEEADLHVILL